MQRVHIIVTGFVQGVGFRHGARSKAQELGLTGWVKNTVNGKVEIVAEGQKEKLEKLVGWAGKGPFLAEIEDIEVEWQESSGEFSSFEIE